MWDEPGKPKQTAHSDSGPGYNEVFTFPAGASNIRLKITNDTGEPWNPTREIINRSLTMAELNQCLVVDGKATDPRLRFESCEKP
jgi:hypothetical protein